MKSDSAGFSDLLHAVTRAAHPLVSKPLGVEALEFVVRYPGWAPNTAFNNLLFGYLALGRFDDALTRMDDALKEAPNNPSIYHNAACIFFPPRRRHSRPRLHRQRFLTQPLHELS